MIRTTHVWNAFPSSQRCSSHWGFTVLLLSLLLSLLLFIVFRQWFLFGCLFFVWHCGCFFVVVFFFVFFVCLFVFSCCVLFFSFFFLFSFFIVFFFFFFNCLLSDYCGCRLLSDTNIITFFWKGSWLICCSLVCRMGAALSLGVIGRLCFVIVAVPGHLLYCLSRGTVLSYMTACAPSEDPDQLLVRACRSGSSLGHIHFLGLYKIQSVFRRTEKTLVSLHVRTG